MGVSEVSGFSLPGREDERESEIRPGRSRTVLTVLGPVQVRRAYYHCRSFRAGHCPRDARLGLTGSDLSRGAADAVALAGAMGRFAEAVTKTLPE